MSDLSFDGGRGVAVRDDRKGDWMQTWGGGRFWPADPHPEDIDLLDCAFALGNTSRYAGHCLFYSVAEHSVLVSQIVPPGEELSGWAHDLPEVLGIADIVRPTKRCVGRDNAIFELERNIWRKAVAPRFDLPDEIPEPVILADTQIVVLEKAVLHPRSQEWHLPFPMPKGVKIHCLEPHAAAMAWLNRYQQLTGISVAPVIEELLGRIIADRQRVLSMLFEKEAA